jgi:hypothetical protein
MEALKGYKTAIFNVVMPLLLMYASFNPGSDTPDAAAVHQGLTAIESAITIIWAAGNWVLRAFSNTTMFKKTSPAPMPEDK